MLDLPPVGEHAREPIPTEWRSSGCRRGPGKAAHDRLQGDSKHVEDGDDTEELVVAGVVDLSDGRVDRHQREYDGAGRGRPHEWSDRRRIGWTTPPDHPGDLPERRGGGDRANV